LHESRCENASENVILTCAIMLGLTVPQTLLSVADEVIE
jgi:hypothetical protein